MACGSLRSQGFTLICCSKNRDIIHIHFFKCTIQWFLAYSELAAIRAPRRAPVTRRAPRLHLSPTGSAVTLYHARTSLSLTRLDVRSSHILPGLPCSCCPPGGLWADPLFVSIASSTPSPQHIVRGYVVCAPLSPPWLGAPGGWERYLTPCTVRCVFTYGPKWRGLPDPEDPANEGGISGADFSPVERITDFFLIFLVHA